LIIETCEKTTFLKEDYGGQRARTNWGEETREDALRAVNHRRPPRTLPDVDIVDGKTVGLVDL